MKRIFPALFGLLLLPLATTHAAGKKRLLAIGEEKGYRHESVSHALATIERLGRESGLWDTTIRTDTEALTKKKLEYNAKNLNDFDAVLFYTGGTLEMDDQKKADFLSFIHDDGKGFIGIHSATITFTDWPEYGEMIGGYFDEHPWGTFDAPIVVEDPSFPGMEQWPHSFIFHDEIYQIRNFSRDKLRVLMRLDASKLDLTNSAGAPQGSGFRGHMGQDVRQGAAYITRRSAIPSKIGTGRRCRPCMWERSNGPWVWWMPMSRRARRRKEYDDAKNICSRNCRQVGQEVRFGRQRA